MIRTPPGNRLIAAIASPNSPTKVQSTDLSIGNTVTLNGVTAGSTLVVLLPVIAGAVTVGDNKGNAWTILSIMDVPAGYGVGFGYVAGTFRIALAKAENVAAGNTTVTWNTLSTWLGLGFLIEFTACAITAAVQGVLQNFPAQNLRCDVPLSFFPQTVVAYGDNQGIGPWTWGGITQDLRNGSVSDAIQGLSANPSSIFLNQTVDHGALDVLDVVFAFALDASTSHFVIL
jgi:hypothetical protein